MRKNILKLTKMLIIYINLMIFSLWTSNAQSNEYHLTSGVYKAIEVKFQYKNLSLDVHRLMNIPYAQTPQLFDKPAETFSSNSNMSFAQSSNKWPNMCVQTRIFNADFYGNLRLPHKTYMSFDCLTINLYIPADRAGNLSAMFFVHGGSNAVGTSSYVDASVLASLGNVLVATVNYRLDVLGFFSMPSSSSSKEKKYKGNYGLWDQLAAIKWLYKNCPSLGCNPDSITLFGHSAGSANVLFHALSEHARPYVKRIIMQSGSGLAHWATNYEQYLIDISESGNKQALSLFKNSRYFNTAKDTLINFLALTKCNQTQKHICLKEKLVKFKKLNAYFDEKKIELAIRQKSSTSTSASSRAELTDLKILKSFWNLINIISFNDFCFMFGYLFKLKHNVIKNSIHLNTLKQRTPAQYEFFFQQVNSLNKTEKVKSNFISRIRTMLSEHNLNLQTNSADQDDPCYSDLHSVVRNYESCYEICQFLYEINVSDTTGYVPHGSDPKPRISSGDYFVQSPVISFFLSCFTQSYLNEDNSNGIFDFNAQLILTEMEMCVNSGILNHSNDSDINKPSFVKLVDQDWNDYQIFSDDEDENENFINSLDNSVFGGPKSSLIVKEIASLSDDIKNLHRPNIDHDYIHEHPQLKLIKDKDIGMDLMIGNTNHESFYFLEFSYNLEDILNHAFIYSSLLNLTSNLIVKLTTLDRQKSVTVCLKKHLLTYYNIDQSEHSNSLVKNQETLNLIDDFEFNLPMITHLKLNMQSNSTKKLYAYQFNFESAFNYMLKKSMPYSDVYQFVFMQLNNTVVPHFSELDYVFGLPILSEQNLIKYKTNNFNYNYTQDELALSVLMIKYWSNFAKYGDPNHEIENSSQWEPFSSLYPNILNINSKLPKSNVNLIKEWLKKHEFWYETLPNVLYNDCLVNSADSLAFIFNSRFSLLIALLVAKIKLQI